MTKIKICGLFRDQNIDYVNEARPDYAGFILHFPKSHRNLDVDRALMLRERLLPQIRLVCVFVDHPLDTVIRTAEALQADVIQLHGHENDDYIEELRERTGKEIWKAFRVRCREDLDAAYLCKADMVLLDNGYGTGQTFDWSLLEAFGRPFILAGGLTPFNISEAIGMLGPVAVDLSSGVETDKEKDRDKIMAAVEAAHR